MVRPDQPNDGAPDDTSAQSDDHDPRAGSDDPPADPVDPAEEREPDQPSWAGAPGYHPQDPDDDPEPGDVAGPDRPGYQRVPDGMAAHAPLPGAPPYPAPTPARPTTASGLQPDATPFPNALAAAGIWLAVNLLVNVVFYGSPGSLVGVATLACFTLVLALGLWFLLRQRRLPFWQVLLIAAPLYWILRIVLFPWLI